MRPAYSSHRTRRHKWRAGRRERDGGIPCAESIRPRDFRSSRCPTLGICPRFLCALVFRSREPLGRRKHMPYRSNAEAVRARKEELQRELADVKRRCAEHAYLEWRAQELETELADIAKREAAFSEKNRLPKIANACNADWEQMTGDDQVRFCKSCEKNVYNLSAMTAEAAEALIVEKEGN